MSHTHFICTSHTRRLSTGDNGDDLGYQTDSPHLIIYTWR